MISYKDTKTLNKENRNQILQTLNLETPSIPNQLSLTTHK
jgi:hypothetical protein